MILIVLALSVAMFVAVLRLTGAVAVATAATTTAREAARILRASDLDDAEKEARSRRAAAALFGSFLRITAIGVAALAVSFAVVWLGAALGFYILADAIAVASGWPFLIGASILATLAWVAIERRPRGAS